LSFLPNVATGLTGADGAFEIDGLPPGPATLCVEARQSEALDPCIWDNKQTVQAVPASGTASGIAVTARRGVTVVIRVNDPESLMISDPTGVDIRISTHHGGFSFIPARTIVKDRNGKTFALVVPANGSVEIKPTTGKFTLVDGKGNGVNGNGNGPPIVVNAPASTGTTDLTKKTPDLTVQITGKTNHP
jgi:hypothetical protein